MLLSLRYPFLTSFRSLCPFVRAGSKHATRFLGSGDGGDGDGDGGGMQAQVAKMRGLVRAVSLPHHRNRKRHPQVTTCRLIARRARMSLKLGSTNPTSLGLHRPTSLGVDTP